MLMRFLRKISCAITLLRVGALKVFWDQLRHQIYSRDVHIGIAKSLDSLEKNPIECPVNYNLREASKEDINEAFEMVKTESKESAQMLLNRKWLYECGCGKWFVARTTDNDDLCYFQCVISAEDNERLDKGFRTWFPRLKEGEIIFEGAYTFENYRRNKLAGSVLFDLMEIYRNKGSKRVIGYIDKKSESQLKRTEARGFIRFEEVSLMKTMFSSKRKSRPC